MVMNKGIVFFCLVCTLLSASSALALKVSGLYEAGVAVADQSAGGRISAIRSALSAVLVKLTGDKDAASRLELKPIIDAAERYVLQYRYYQNDPSSATDAADNGLLVLFDETALNKALLDNGIAVWGQERPSVLIWLVAQTATGAGIIGLGDETTYLNIIDKRARARGIPLIFPLLDIEDRSKVRIDDIRAGVTEPVVAASNRYRSDVILLGSIEPSPSSAWEIRWTAIIRDQTSTWSSRAERVEVALTEGIDEIADRLVDSYANIQAQAQQEALTLVVNDVDTLDQYARVLRYLESLNSVTDIKVRQLQGNSITFAITNLGGISAIVQAISLGDTLVAIADPPGTEFRLKKH